MTALLDTLQEKRSQILEIAGTERLMGGCLGRWCEGKKQKKEDRDFSSFKEVLQ